MSSTAQFTISGSAFVNGGYDANNGQVLSLQIETLTTDIRKVVFSQVTRSKGAPDLGGPWEAASPGDAVNVAMPGSGAHTYIFRCQVNDGIDALAKTVEAWTKERAVAIRTAAGHRKICPAERTEYESPDGWTGAINDVIDDVQPAEAAPYSKTWTGLAMNTSHPLEMDNVVLPSDCPVCVDFYLFATDQVSGAQTAAHWAGYYQKTSNTLSFGSQDNQGNYNGAGNITGLGVTNNNPRVTFFVDNNGGVTDVKVVAEVRHWDLS